ncbi:tRNA adenosine(34) deaminase TadA [Thermatribacter velox]|uniref:tRNA-specific adenosine deaminase n=1 Tax=Thermatribacter velox TaxID=3039681 RepID=A0ABZ2YG81_9BACT
MDHKKFMEIALKEAWQAFQEDEVPVGACLVKNGQIVSCGHNRREKLQDVTSHAEIETIRKASQELGTWRLENCILYVTLEPCPMCAGAIIQARIHKVYFGARDPKAGAAGSKINLFQPGLFNHTTEIEGGLLAEKCSQILKQYFKIKREQSGEVAELDEGARLEIE